METLVGLYLTCTVSFWSYHPDLKQDVMVTAENIACLVVDDRFDPVGFPGEYKTPIVVDCSKAISWLNPKRKSSLFTFMKEEKDCDYE